MKKIKLPVIAVSAVLGFVACGEDSAIAPSDYGAVSPVEISSDSGNPASSGDAIGAEILSSSDVLSGFDASSSSNGLPAVASSSSVTSGNGNSSSSVPPVHPNVSSSSAFNPGNKVSSSSAVIPNNGGSDEDENDNEDARTLNGSQILLKVSGTSATVENNNGCVEVADKSATITCPGAYFRRKPGTLISRRVTVLFGTWTC